MEQIGARRPGQNLTHKVTAELRARIESGALKPGDKLQISNPTNHFELGDHAEPAVLIAGGIGITPILSMAAELAARGRPFEAHYAVYEPDGFYKRHLDSFRGARNRVLSSVLYLNRDWHASDGGQLRIYAPDSEGVVETVQPEFGTLAVFLSEDIPHEVVPARRERFSIAGWHRCNDRGLAPALQTRALPIPA